MKVMTPGWINAVFTASQHSGLTYATDHDFAKYKCPVFYNLAFSVSGYGSKKKETFKVFIYILHIIKLYMNRKNGFF